MKEVIEQTERLSASKFKQQTLKLWRPSPSLKQTFIAFGVFGLIFLSIGSVLRIMSANIKETMVQYHAECGTPKLPPFIQDINQNNCVLMVQIEEDMEEEVYIYY